MGVFGKLGKKKKSNAVDDVHNPEARNEVATQHFDVVVQELSIDSLPNITSLVELKDRSVLEKVNHLVPGLIQFGTTTANVIQAKSKVLYEVIIPNGYSLAKSRDMDGAFRGFYHGETGIKGHANIVKAGQRKMNIANAASSAMSVSSMIVGQYYMSQIDAKLNLINDSINRIVNFLENEYRSKIIGLISQIRSITSCQSEILEKAELRSIELSRLTQLENNCIELLGQASLSIDEICKKKDLEYKKYEKEVQKADNWLNYQNVLLEVLHQITDMKYTLHLGEASKDYCQGNLRIYSNKVIQSQTALNEWHTYNTNRLGIDLINQHRKRPKLVRDMLSFVGLNQLVYIPVAPLTADQIQVQSSLSNRIHADEEERVFNENVRLISKDGIIYYCPPIKRID